MTLEEQLQEAYERAAERAPVSPGAYDRFLRRRASRHESSPPSGSSACGTPQERSRAISSISTMQSGNASRRISTTVQAGV